MKCSETGKNLIKKFESCKLTAYKDSKGIFTIGYGHTKNVKSGMKITKKKAIELFESDVVIFEKKVNKYVNTYNFTQSQFDALVSFAFNIGSIDQLTNNGKRSIKEISNKILLYNKCGGKVLNGLVKRRKAEKQLFDKETRKTVEEIAKEVINGKYGNGIERINNIAKLGYNYNEVQNVVNKLLKR